MEDNVISFKARQAERILNDAIVLMNKFYAECPAKYWHRANDIVVEYKNDIPTMIQKLTDLYEQYEH